jgi:hypothetical protein
MCYHVGMDETKELNRRINTLIMRGLSAGEARYQALTEQGNPLAGLIAAFDTERERIEAQHG